MKKTCWMMIAVLGTGLMFMTSCHSKKEMVANMPDNYTPMNTPDANTVPANMPDTTIGVILAAPVTMEVSTNISGQMKQQQEELVNGWEIVEVEANQTDTLVSVEIVQDPNNLDAIKLGLNDSVLFKFNSAALSPKADGILSKLVEHLQSFPETNVTVVGYASHTGAAEYNLDLSMDRAQNVMDYLVAKGVNPARLKAIGKGWTNPVASNATAAGRAKNQRVEIWITPSQEMIDNAQ